MATCVSTLMQNTQKVAHRERAGEEEGTGQVILRTGTFHPEDSATHLQLMRLKQLLLGRFQDTHQKSLPGLDLGHLTLEINAHISLGSGHHISITQLKHLWQWDQLCFRYKALVIISLGKKESLILPWATLRGIIWVEAVYQRYTGILNVGLELH